MDTFQIELDESTMTYDVFKYTFRECEFFPYSKEYLTEYSNLEDAIDRVNFEISRVNFEISNEYDRLRYGG